MSKGNKEKVFEPIVEGSLNDIIDSTNSSTSGSPCICKDKRNIACTLHGG